MSSNPQERSRISVLSLASPGPRGAQRMTVTRLDPGPKREARTWGNPDPEQSIAMPWVVCGLVSAVLIAAVVVWVAYWATVPEVIAEPPVAAAPKPEPEPETPSIRQVAAAMVPPAAEHGPIPEPGERITKPQPAKIINSAEPGLGATLSDTPADSAPVVAAPKGVIAWDQAGQYVGQDVVVEGTIVDTKNAGSVCMLTFSRGKDGFYLAMFDKAMGGWGEAPEKYFLGKTVRVTGKVSTYKGRPQIKIEDSKQVTVVDKAPAPAPAPAVVVAESAPAAQPAVVPAAAAALPTIAWSQASKFVGQQVTVEGVVVDTVKSKSKSVFLNFSSLRSSFYVVIFEAKLGSFTTPPEEAFKGKKVQVTGRITTYQDRPQIKIESASQIKVVE